MADAQFWFDMRDDFNENSPHSGSYRFPPMLFGMLEDEKEIKWPTLWDIWDRPKNLTHIELDRKYALFARGTTGEIVKALKKDKDRIQYIAFFKDHTIDMRFIRQKVSKIRTVSIVGIATSRYWGNVRAYSTADADPSQPWAQLRPAFRHGLDTYRHNEWVEYVGITLGGLIETVERGKGVHPWF